MKDLQIRPVQDTGPTGFSIVGRVTCTFDKLRAPSLSRGTRRSIIDLGNHFHSKAMKPGASLLGFLDSESDGSFILLAFHPRYLDIILIR